MNPEYVSDGEVEEPMHPGLNPKASNGEVSY